MILGFRKQFPSGQLTYFSEKIFAGVSPDFAEDFIPKIHSIRKGDRWREGMSIQMAYGVRTPFYYQFNQGVPALETCVSVQKIVLNTRRDTYMKVVINGRSLSFEEIEELAINDGFDCLDDFWNWFGHKYFEGQIIHWTDKRY